MKKHHMKHHAAHHMAKTPSMKGGAEKSMGDDRFEGKGKKGGEINANYEAADGTHAVHTKCDDDCFDGGDELEEGETNYTGGGANEKHS